MAYLISSILAVISRNMAAWVTFFIHILAMQGHLIRMNGSMVSFAAEEVVRAGVLSYAPGSESEHVSLVSPFIDWSRFVGLCLFVGGGFVCFCAVLFDSLTNLCDRVINR